MLEHKVLYLDDEENNLHSFRANFRDKYKVFTAQTAEEALEVALENDICVAVADQRMPGKTGVEFFEELIEHKPDIIRILLTGYSDINAVIDAINKGQVYRYLTKPWNREELGIALDNAVDLYQTRRRLKEKEESLDKAKTELDKFVYSVSHDLRSPLMSILGVIDLAENEVTDQESIEYFKLIKQLVNRLDGFVLQVIDYYKGTHNFDDVHSIDFNELVGQVLENFKYNPLTEGVEVHSEIKQDGTFYSSGMKLSVILNNLISNAFKYQREKSEEKPRIEVRVTADDEEAVITVKDNGAGIAEDKLRQIFNMFFRASRKNSGSGIGLYIVKESVERLKGSIDVDSKEGQGTTFVVTLPTLAVDNPL